MDGAGDIPKNWKAEYNVHVIPINIHFENKRLQQGVDPSDDDFYHIVETSGVIPKTSQPTPQQFVDFFNRLAQTSDTIFSLHVTGKLSGTYNSAVLAAQEIKNILNIIIFNSGSGSAAMGFMCKEARQLEKAGASLQAIIKRLEVIRNNLNIILNLDTLEYARRSGRVNALSAVLAAVVKNKPVVILKDSALDMGEKVRTRQRAINRVLEIIHEQVGDRLINVAVVHSQSLDAAKDLLRKVRETFQVNEVILSDLSIAIVANLGPRTIGIVAYAES